MNPVVKVDKKTGEVIEQYSSVKDCIDRETAAGNMPYGYQTFLASLHNNSMFDSRLSYTYRLRCNLGRESYMKGNKSVRNVPVWRLKDGQITWYPSTMEASRQTGDSPQLIRYRLKKARNNPSKPQYIYQDFMGETEQQARERFERKER